MFLFRMSLVVSLRPTTSHNAYSINAGLDVIYFSCNEQNGIKYTDTVYTCKFCIDMLNTQLSDSFRFGSIIEAMKIHVCWVEGVTGWRAADSNPLEAGRHPSLAWCWWLLCPGVLQCRAADSDHKHREEPCELCPQQARAHWPDRWKKHTKHNRFMHMEKLEWTALELNARWLVWGSPHPIIFIALSTLGLFCISSKKSLACPPVGELSSAGWMFSLAFSHALTILLKKTAFSPSYFSTNSLSGSGQSCAQTHTDTTKGRKDLENYINEPCAHLKPHFYPHMFEEFLVTVCM